MQAKEDFIDFLEEYKSDVLTFSKDELLDIIYQTHTMSYK